MDASSAPFSIAILAGGQSRRMGRDKALIALDGQPILQRVILAVQNLTDDLFLVANAPHRYRAFGLPVIPDILPGKAALGGIYTAIARARYEWVLVLACDMPFLDPRVIALLADHRRHADVVVPRIAPQPETLHAFYRKTCLPAIRKRLAANRLRIIGFFEEVTVTYLPADVLQTVAPNFDFLINLNTPDELERARQILARRKGGAA